MVDDSMSSGGSDSGLRKGYEHVADVLASLGVPTIFGLLGTTNMRPFGSANSRVQLVSTRHEATAVTMADGYSRTAGGLGIATVTSGPGLTNAGTAIVAASRARSSLLIFTGDVGAEAISRVQQIDQRRFAEACEARYVEVSGPFGITNGIREAARLASDTASPVIVSVPEAVQMASIQEADIGSPTSVTAAEAASAPSIDVGLLGRAVHDLRSSKSPVFVCGLGAMDPEVKDKVLLLADLVGALLATTLPAKGLFLDEAWDVGIAGGFASAAGQRLMRGADLVFGVCCSLSPETVDGGRMFPVATVWRIDRDGRPGSPGQLIQADASEVLDQLIRALGSESGAPGFRRPDIARELRAQEWSPNDTNTEAIDPRVLTVSLDRAIPTDARIVVGAGHFWAFPIMYMTGSLSNRWLFSYSFGTIGHTLGLAMGSWFADPSRPIVVLDGDGSFMQYCQEIDTAVRYMIPVKVVVANDSGFGSEAHKLRAEGLREDISYFDSPDIARLSEALGAWGQEVRISHDLKRSLRDLIELSGPGVLDVRISPDVVNDMYRQRYFGSDNRAPHLRRASGGRGEEL